MAYFASTPAMTIDDRFHFQRLQQGIENGQGAYLVAQLAGRQPVITPLSASFANSTLRLARRYSLRHLW